MTFKIKAIATVLVLSLAPAVAGAQTLNIGGGGVVIGNGSALGAILRGEPRIGGGWVPAPGEGQPVVAQDCGASQAQYWVGQDIAHVNVPGSTRVLGPNTFGTADYDPQRLNVEHDAHGTISRVYCG